MIRKKYRMSVYILVVLMAIVSTSVAFGSITNIGQPNKGVIFFNRPVTWEDVLDFSERYQVTPTSLYMASFGLSGTYRRYDRMGTKEFLEDADNRSIYVFKQSVEGNIRMIRKFLKQHSLADLKNDDAVLTEGKSLLLLQYQLDSMYQRLTRRGDIVYAIEVSGVNDRNYVHIKQDILTKRVVRFSTMDRLFKQQMPEDSDISYDILSRKVSSMVPEQVYKEMVSISLRGGER